MEILENWGDNDKEEEPLEMPKKPLRGLILTPTRELAIQIKNHLEAAAKFTNIKVRNYCSFFKKVSVFLLIKYRLNSD